jgi:hypothetical protein
MEFSKKRGRPKQNCKRNNIVSAYITAEENNKLKEKAKEADLSVSAFLRKIIMEKIK